LTLFVIHLCMVKLQIFIVCNERLQRSPNWGVAPLPRNHSGQPLASQSLTAKILQGIDAKRAMIAGERRHTPHLCMVKLQIFIVCNERLQRSPNWGVAPLPRNHSLEDVCDQAHFLADMMLEYEWEDSKWPYQLEVAQQVSRRLSSF
jgi:hypothetical protein